MAIGVLSKSGVCYRTDMLHIAGRITLVIAHDINEVGKFYDVNFIELLMMKTFRLVSLTAFDE
jgi:hypothetical protein